MSNMNDIKNYLIIEIDKLKFIRQIYKIKISLSNFDIKNNNFTYITNEGLKYKIPENKPSKNYYKNFKLIQLKNLDKLE